MLLSRPGAAGRGWPHRHSESPRSELTHRFRAGEGHRPQSRGTWRPVRYSSLLAKSPPRRFRT